MNSETMTGRKYNFNPGVYSEKCVSCLPCNDVARVLLSRFVLGFIDQLTKRDGLFGQRTRKGWVNMLRNQDPSPFQWVNMLRIGFFFGGFKWLFLSSGGVGRFRPEYSP